MVAGIHLGSREAGPKVAAILSVMETCRRMGIAAREYLGAVLPGLSRVSIQRIAELTPAAWAGRRQQTTSERLSRVELV